MIKSRIRRVVESQETAAGKAFDIVIQTLIALSLVAITVETLPDLSPELRAALEAFEVFCVIVFTAEYLLRIYVAESKRAFVFSFYGIVDLLAILPFYIAAGGDFRSIRALRFFRLFRMFKLVRYSRALQRFRLAFSTIRQELLLFMLACCLLLYFSALGIYHFEHEAQPEQFDSLFSSFWWAVATLTTVGYGDVYPITLGGRLFTVGILFVGLGIVAVPAGLVASALSQVLSKERAAKAEGE